MFCSQCGSQLGVGSAFCGACGSGVGGPGPAGTLKGKDLHLTVGRITSPAGRELNLSISVRGDGSGYITVAIVPDEEDYGEEVSCFLTNLQGLTELKRLIVETERTVEKVQRSGQLRRLAF